MSTWYIAEDKRRNVRQIVIDCPVGPATDSMFGTLVLGQKYDNLISQTWTAGFFRTDAQPGPYLLVRADNHVQGLRICPLKIAFSFYREPAGGLFGTFVVADSDMLREASPTGHAIFEYLTGIDLPDCVQRIRAAMSRASLHLCFADATRGFSVVSIGPGGTSERGKTPSCRFDRVFPMPPECSAALLREFDELLAYHRNSPRDLRRSFDRMTQDFPARLTPLLPPPVPPPTAGSEPKGFFSALWHRSRQP